MGDVNGDETTILHRAKEPIKDNRLAPIGFTTTHISYDTTAIFGSALNDPNFNRYENGEEGNGSDRIRYNIALNGYGGSLRAFARVHYQPVPPGWNEEMFSHSSPENDQIQSMIGNSDGTPTLVVADSITLGPLSIDDLTADRIMIHPNPTYDGWIGISADLPIEVISVHDVAGRIQRVAIEKRSSGWRIQLPTEVGMYSILLKIGDREILKRVIRS